MLTTFIIHCLKASAGLLVLVGGWLLVEAARRRVFGEPVSEEGVPSCHGCTHHCSEDSGSRGGQHACQNEFQATPPVAERPAIPSLKRGE